MHNNKISSQPKKANHHDRFFKSWYSDPAFAKELLQLVLTQTEQQAYDSHTFSPPPSGRGVGGWGISIS